MDELQLQRERRTTTASRSSRAQPSGVSALVADRASRWTLDDPDWEFLEIQKYFSNPLMDYWFHSRGPLPWDAWTVGVQWWRHFGRARPLHGTAHDALMAAPMIGAYFRRT